MPKFNEVLGTIASDAATYFVKDNKVANNAVVASAVVASPDILTVVSQLSSGVDLSSALAAGGTSMYLAIGLIVLRFALYVVGKTKAQEAK